VTVVPVDLADLLPVVPSLAERAMVHLAPTTLRGLAQAWDAGGGPVLEAPAPSAGAVHDVAADGSSPNARHDPPGAARPGPAVDGGPATPPGPRR